MQKQALYFGDENKDKNTFSIYKRNIRNTYFTSKHANDEQIYAEKTLCNKILYNAYFYYEAVCLYVKNDVHNVSKALLCNVTKTDTYFDLIFVIMKKDLNDKIFFFPTA